MKHFAFILVLTFLASACHQKQEKKTVTKLPLLQASSEIKKSNHPFANINLYDDLNNELILDTLEYNRDAQFSPLYIGDLKDDIKLTYKISKLKHGTSLDFNYVTPKSSDFTIFIDTTKTIGFPVSMFEHYKKAEYRTNKKSYPVFIKNKSADTLHIGLGDILYMRTEAQDTTGNWQEIERDHIYFCGTGLRSFYLNPNQIAVTALRQNYGRYKTKFRIRFGNLEHKIYSNEIDGYLDFEL
ncbi:MAG: hypothetical protein AB8B65_08385 [Kordia sp.]|uniref:hypothetical protein n=1 Tax=Kordia sp. TaxID=1965332 RepID=UPI00385FA19A